MSPIDGEERDLRHRFGDVREYHASFFTKYLRQLEIDFIHGGVLTSAFMRNYFNPAFRTLSQAEKPF